MQPQNREGFKPTPKAERSEVRGKVGGKKKENIKEGLWLPINSARAPDLRSRGRSGLLWESSLGDSGHVSQRDSSPFFNFVFSLFASALS